MQIITKCIRGSYYTNFFIFPYLSFSKLHKMKKNTLLVYADADDDDDDDDN